MRKAIAVGVKVFLSAFVVVLFLVISARLPYLEPGGSADSWDTVSGVRSLFTPDTFRGASPAEISFADANALFSGQFYLADEGIGFETREIDVQGPCEDAGLRYLEQYCDDCNFTETPEQPGLPPTLFWMGKDKAAGESGNVLRDCVAELPEGKVRVALISYDSDQLTLADDIAAGSGMPTSALPEVPGATRVSVMSLGEWSIVVDEIENHLAFDHMEQRLLIADWEKIPDSVVRSPDGSEQRIYQRGASELCVVTQAVDGESLQLITMTNGF